ncbi:hypothetical protein TeGR_g12322 [Tetraparma gracilis]|jgi:hypothetical protein|uniref:Polyprenol reductase n=1 Tax=Tetraparma gracilis TaxID=2962635 RepID=A0ABQ6N8H8_9STRA|nr:hypothetical protein TeGR_g12322 [Tetraparma gracilis]
MASPLLAWLSSPSPPPAHLLPLFYLTITLTCYVASKDPSLASLSLHGFSRHTSPPPPAPFPLSLVSTPVPKKRFVDFYALSCLVCSLLLASPKRSFPLLLFLLHSARRLYECLHVHNPTPHSNMTRAAYLLGLCYYLVTPFAYTGPGTPSSTFTGLLLFVLANAAQHFSHKALADSRAASPPDAPYPAPPTAWLFRYTLAPHFFAEVCIYASLLLLRLGPSPAPLHLNPALWALIWVHTALTASAGNSAVAVEDKYPGVIGERGELYPDAATFIQDCKRWHYDMAKSSLRGRGCDPGLVAGWEERDRRAVAEMTRRADGGADEDKVVKRKGKKGKRA